MFGQVSCQAFAGVGARLVAVPGGAAHAGLLEMEMEAGGYGTVCGLNSQAANVACRQIGFEFGVVSPAGCAEYGGASFCGASGSPVAAKALQCAGAEQRHAMPRRKNQWHCPAPGLGTRLGNLCGHEDRVGAAKTANRFISFMGLRGLTHVLRIVQTAAVIAWM